MDVKQDPDSVSIYSRGEKGVSVGQVALDTPTAYIIDHKAERQLCRIFDFRILPILAICYLANALDN